MAETPVMLVYHPAQPKDSLGLSSTLFKTLGLPLHQPVTLTWPGHEVILKPYLNQSQANVLHLPSPLAEHLHLPDKSAIYASYHPSTRTVKLRPVLAILVSGLAHPQPFGGLNDFLSEVIRYAQKRAVVAYVITLPDMAALKGPLWGWTYEGEEWKKKRFPLPHVVYNRISSRKIERSNLYNALKKRLEKEGIRLFNQTFLNKWETYVTLTSQEETKKYVPHTVYFDGVASLKEMLKKYPVLYLKPIHGSLGRGIYKLLRTPSGFQAVYNTLSGEMVRYFFSLKSLVIFLSKRIKGPYILQEGIDLLHVEGGPVDFRVLMQKNGKGQWQVTSLVARIGGQNQIVSNISRGGKMARALPTLKLCGVAHPQALRQKMVALAKEAAKAIDQGKNGLLGELGIDLAVTAQEKIYILEVNAKPSKTAEALPAQGKKVRPSVRHLVEYTLYLSRMGDEVES